MDVPLLVIYGVASLLALRCLMGMMTAYKQRLLKEDFNKREAARLAEEARLQGEREAAKKNSGGARKKPAA